jgi:hypothetical protein
MGGSEHTVWTILVVHYALWLLYTTRTKRSMAAYIVLRDICWMLPKYLCTAVMLFLFFLAVMLCITKYTIMALLTDNLVDNN